VTADQALGGLDAVMRRPGPSPELVVRHHASRGEVVAILELREDPAWPARTTWRGEGRGATVPEALAHLWAGPLGVWRYVDPEAWGLDYAARWPHPPAGNPGPLAGQRLGRGDG
jgi:hypothetical protein